MSLRDRYDFSQELAKKADSYTMQECLKAKASVIVTDNLERRVNGVENRTVDIINFINHKICPVIRIEAMQ